MRRIRDRNTGPELMVRRFLHSAGLRFRLHVRALPGKPDLVFPSRRACVFVHGCFWHGCPLCIDGRRAVKSNSRYWKSKVEGNRTRDKRNEAKLRADGWTVFTVWECELRAPGTLPRLASQIRSLTAEKQANWGRPRR